MQLTKPELKLIKVILESVEDDIENVLEKDNLEEKHELQHKRDLIRIMKLIERIESML